MTTIKQLAGVRSPGQVTRGQQHGFYTPSVWGASRSCHYVRPVELTVESGGLALTTPYHPDFVAAFKSAIPSSARRWQADRRIWLVDAAVGPMVADLCQKFFETRPAIPTVFETTTRETRTMDVRYVGATKRRDAGGRSAYGFSRGAWGVVFPEAALMDWFRAAPVGRGESQTLFATLGIGRDADSKTVKTAYRRLAFQWHPDRCHEPDATEVFKTLVNAYEILSDDVLRERYVRSLGRERPSQGEFDGFGFRPPLRCGMVQVEGFERIAIFHVEKIVGWDDITDSSGRVLVTSWRQGAVAFDEEWSWF